MKIKVGIIGAGHMGSTHGRILARDSRVEVVGITDVRGDAAGRLAAEIGSRVYSSLDDMLEARIHALYVTTPNTLHVPPVVHALTNGIHVFSEKPMATSLEEAAKILKAAKASRAIYQVGFNYRFAPAHKFIKDLIEQGRLKPYHCHIKDNRGELIEPAWVSDTKITGGYLYESTIHTLDLMTWLMGNIKTMKCVARSNVYSQLDDYAILFEFANGSLGTLDSCAHASWLFPAGSVEVFGEHSTVTTDEMERVRYTTGLKQEILEHDYFQLPTEHKWGYVEEDKLFIDAIVEGKPSVVPAEEAYRAIELIEACSSQVREASVVGI